MFKYDWSRFDAKLGLIFMIGMIVVFGLMEQLGFSMLVAGISALLAWLTVIMVPNRKWGEHILGLVIYLVGGILFGVMAKESTHKLVLAAEGMGETLAMLTWIVFGACPWRNANYRLNTDT
jgi:hypothetical protein